MHDFLAAALLADGISRRHHPTRQVDGDRPEPESPWSRVLAWHRRRHRS